MEDMQSTGLRTKTNGIPQNDKGKSKEEGGEDEEQLVTVPVVEEFDPSDLNHYTHCDRTPILTKNSPPSHQNSLLPSRPQKKFTMKQKQPERQRERNNGTEN